MELSILAAVNEARGPLTTVEIAEKVQSPSYALLCIVLKQLFGSLSTLQVDADATAVTGVLRSLAGDGLLSLEQLEKAYWGLTPEGEIYADKGSPEAQMFAAVPDDGVALDELNVRIAVTYISNSLMPQALFKDVAKIGMAQAMQQKWLRIDKSGAPKVLKNVLYQIPPSKTS